jgi:outer membrane protein assembly factor BamB
MRFFVAACAAALAALGIQAAQAQDATAFQLNPAHDGNVAMAGIQPPLKLLWKRTLTGTDLSYPVIAGGRIFVTMMAFANNEYEGTNVVALDATTGKVLWKKLVNNEPETDASADNASSLTYDNGLVIDIDRYNVLTAFDARSGKIKWSQLQGRYDLPGSVSPPTAYNGTIYLDDWGAEGVSEKKGMANWVSSYDGGTPSSPAIGDGGMYLASACSYYKYALTDGSVLWHDGSNCGGGGATSLFFDNMLIVRDEGQGNLILDAGTGATLGTYPQNAPTNMVPAFYESSGGRFMVVPGGTSLVDYNISNPASVAQAWSVSLNGEQMATAPLVVNGYVLEGTTAGNLYMLSEQGETVWSAKLGAPIVVTNERGNGPLSGMGAGDGIIVVPTENSNAGKPRCTLYAFGPG